MPLAKCSSPLAKCTWPFSSHLLAFFNLARQLATEAPQIQFSFLSLAKTNSIIKSSQKTFLLPTNLKSYDVDDRIPKGVNHLTIDHGEEFRHFVERLPYNFERRIEEVLADTERTTGSRREVTCIMTDAVICSPLGKMAEDMNVPWIAFMENDGSSTSAGCLFSWLDRQKVGSVVYMSFGTVVELDSEELMALAEAIEFSGKPFLWYLKDKCKENLTEGFLERTKEKGMVVSWAPQREILQHGSVGVFVNHGGYHSLQESTLGGVPVICNCVPKMVQGDDSTRGSSSSDQSQMNIPGAGDAQTRNAHGGENSQVGNASGGSTQAENSQYTSQQMVYSVGPQSWNPHGLNPYIWGNPYMVNPMCGNPCLMNPYWVHPSQQKMDVIKQPDFVSQEENSQDPPSRTVQDPKPENVPQKRNVQARKSEKGSSKNDIIKHQNGSTVRSLVLELPRRRIVIFDRAAAFWPPVIKLSPTPREIWGVNILGFVLICSLDGLYDLWLCYGKFSF
ncbi:hypothetical protein JCGZ_16786 [Jatropha curcas]|uniref:Anthocyanidin 3-O-glucosyltransferase n=1 Tax=Jatropha curcas TaxID=180498 RepID=A0A067LH26_JATCU|nr:hypothetical protein JCGZ_16786 [Jatropha curcas]